MNNELRKVLSKLNKEDREIILFNYLGVKKVERGGEGYEG